MYVCLVLGVVNVFNDVIVLAVTDVVITSVRDLVIVDVFLNIIIAISLDCGLLAYGPAILPKGRGGL